MQFVYCHICCFLLFTCFRCLKKEARDSWSKQARTSFASSVSSTVLVKLIKTDFSVRCGVNAGFVYFDETTPLEADRVIDVAGHMQKYADPNTVAVAQNIVEPLNDRAGFAPAKRVVDGYEVYTWRPAD